MSDSPSLSRCRPCAGHPPRPPLSLDKPLHGGPLLVGYWRRTRQTHSDQPLPSRRTKRTLARAATVACLLIIGVLALAFGGGELNPLQVLVFGLAVGGMGYNVYFLYRWFRALARGGRKGTTVLIGAAWLIVSGVVSVITIALGFASCAGGCGGGGTGLADWLFMLATWGIGVGFKRLLDKVHPGGAGKPAVNP